MNFIIFPSAKIVTEDLQGVGRIPAIIYPIDQTRMIDLFHKYYLREAGLKNCAFKIITFEAHDQVARRINNMDQVEVIKLDKLADLGYTVYYALQYVECCEDDGVIINFADVIEMGGVEEPILDRCYYGCEDVSSKWTYFKEQNGVITGYYDKPKDTYGIDTNNMMIGIFHIANPVLLKDLLKHALQEDNAIDSLWIALQRYSEIEPFEMVCTAEWFDIGHIDKYYDMQMTIKSRTFNHITIDKNRGILTKTSDDKEKFIGEIQWYLKLPTDVEYARPRLFSYSMEYANPFISMEYYSYHTLHELFLFGDLSEEQWNNVFRRIRFILNDFRRYTVKDKGIKDSLEEMYINKTVNRLKIMKGEPDFPDYEGNLVVNGICYPSIRKICEMVPGLVKGCLLDIDEFPIIHGDLCFSNIMVDSNYSFIKMIDPRGKFGKYDIYGDWRYELAKLMHSVDGKYDYIIQDKFTMDTHGNHINYVVNYDQSVDIMGCFYRIFADEMKKCGKQIKLIESLLFFSMIPLHKESKKQQNAMLATAVTLLADIIDLESSQKGYYNGQI